MSSRSWKTRCCLCGCQNGEISYFKFPSNQNMKRKWLEFCQFENIRSNYKLCGQHFTNDCIVLNKKRTFLKRNSIPTIHVESMFPCIPKRKNVIKNSTSRHTCLLCQSKSPKRSYFTFPTDREQLSKWLKFCEYAEDELPKISELCHKHFNSGDYYENDNLRRLKRNILPSIYFDEFSPEPVYVKENKIENELQIVALEEEKMQVSLNKFIEVIEKPVYDQRNSNKSPISVYVHEVWLENESLSGIPTIINETNSYITSSSPCRDTSRKYLGSVKNSDFNNPERAMKNFIVARQTILKKNHEIRILRQRNRRLMSRINKLKMIIKNLNGRNPSHQSDGLLLPKTGQTVSINSD